jgi:hypothetical protein
MDSDKTITGFVLIREGKVMFNNTLLFEFPTSEPSAFFNNLYNGLHLNYPKFFKMDNLCKTVFLATETLLKDLSLLNKYKAEELGAVFSNANSSLDTDIKYYHSSLQAPSPALFVYTLPNVAVGELCIRQGIKGETACFVFDIFDPAFQAWYVDTLIDDCKINACVSGWADFFDGKFEAFFYLVESGEIACGIKHNSENLDKLYNNAWKN